MLSERGVLGVVDKGVLEGTNGFFLLVSFSSGLLDRFRDYLRRVNAEQGVSQKDFLVRSVVSVRLFDFFVTKRGDCFFFLVFVEPVFLLPGWLSFFRFNFFFRWVAKLGFKKHVPGVEVRGVKDRVGAFFLLKKVKKAEGVWL